MGTLRRGRSDRSPWICNWNKVTCQKIRLDYLWRCVDRRSFIDRSAHGNFWLAGGRWHADLAGYAHLPANANAARSVVAANCFDCDVRVSTVRRRDVEQ